ncbi:serine protease [Sedimentitalea sp. JM2-8]|uniref:Serine protease n=1 Tax=Sedimentitalea xiamensis TaxID=3050037 RepID=A0ABT7F9Q9_9RHOB|nr:serine protease [Sedimentitalea xiamensis]
MRSLFAVLCVAVLAWGGTATAQQAVPDVVWVQIEAHPNLRVARERAEIFSARLADVTGFSLGGSWYGILLGPYLREDAERVLRSYRADRLIPGDSFIAYSRNLGAQYWPEGANLLNRGTIPAPVTATGTAETAATPLTPAEETPAEARRGEQLLTMRERQDMQIALRAAGFYNSTIDGAFGAGTRQSMSDWQFSNGHEVTGVLTTAQRKLLMDQYNAPLISVGMAPVRDTQAGIAIDLPAGVVAFSRYETPFAHYDATTELGARVLLISQPGTQATLSGLYDIMQTLEIVPLNGPRSRSGNAFTLEGVGNGIVSHTEAALENGQIKGFTLVWPADDEARRNRVLDAMRASFTRIDGVLAPYADGNAVQTIDLLAGLEIRKPRLTRSGFFVDGRGAVLTTSDAVQGCSRLTLNDDHEASVVLSDSALGLAVLRPKEALAPMSVARFKSDAGRLRSEIAVSGFSYDGVLGAPTLTFGSVADVKGLNGDTNLTRLTLTAQSGDAGGPVIDASGAVLGMLLPPPATRQKLPEDVSFATGAGAIRSVLDAAGIPVQDAADDAPLTPDDMSRMATAVTVLVNCWD